jgi:hypothetical protein
VGHFIPFLMKSWQKFCQINVNGSNVPCNLPSLSKLSLAFGCDLISVLHHCVFFPLLVMILLFGVILASTFCFFICLKPHSYTCICIRKQHGLQYSTCVYQLDMHLAMFMVDWYVSLLCCMIEDHAVIDDLLIFNCQIISIMDV